MATEVLLMADVKDVGAAGDVVRVSEGFARNFLLPRKLAASVSPATRRRLAKLQEQRQVERTRDLEAAQALAGRLGALSCTIAVKAQADQKLYGSVTAGDIADALKKLGVTIDKSNILLEQPLKALGIFNVPVKISAEVQATLKVWVVEE
ncbi:MAG: 50S ribosomal protein L9 [Lentisphaerae bacterium]|nr:50S ribosomal protein L9 [Lentisphaerota bacterium]